MKFLILFGLSFLPMLGFAAGLQSADFVGNFSLVGDSSLPRMDLTFNADESVVLVQHFPTGQIMNCVGIYEYEADTKEVAAFYYCDGDQLLAQEIFTGDASICDLSSGLSLQVKLFPSYGNDVTAQMFIQKK